MGLRWGNFYTGWIDDLPGYTAMMAQANTAMEQQKAFMIGLSGVRPTDLLSALMMANYRPPNPIPWEKRYADFCERLATATGRQLSERTPTQAQPG